MKRKLLVVLLLAVVISSVGIAEVVSKKRGENAKAVADSVGSTRTVSLRRHKNINPTDQSGVVDGGNNPELIPDQVAYLLLFRFIAGRNTDAERNRIRDYLRFAGLGCQTCDAQALSTSTATNDAEIDALIAAAEEFQQRVSMLDRQAKEIKDHNWPNPSSAVMAQLTALQQQKENLVTEIVASLPTRLGASGMEKLRRHINERVKRRVRMIPSSMQLLEESVSQQHPSSHH